MSLGENIRNRREQIGMTTVALAGRIGVSQPAITQFETNIRIPNAYLFASIAKALGISMDALMYGGKAGKGTK